MSLYYLLPFALLLTAANSWRLTATFTDGRVQYMNMAVGLPRACDGLIWGNMSINYFDWIPNTGATVIELYPLDNCLGKKRVGVAGRNNVDPDTAYYTYKVLP